MINVITCIIVMMISISIFLGFVKLFSKDDTRISSKSNALNLAIISIILTNLITYYAYIGSNKYFIFSVLNVYLILTGYIDSRTLFVYRLSNYIFGSIGVILLVILQVEVESQLISAILYSSVVLLIACTGGIGKGDAFTLIVIIPYMMFLELGSELLINMIINTMIFNIIFIVSNIKKINIKQMKLKSKSALTPSIAMATIIMVLVQGIIKIHL